jgi:hypothetical protein
MPSNVVLYAPNVINYLRLCMVLFMLYHMRNRPILTFALCIVSGFIDSFDGDLARHFGQTSKLGYLLDLGMDRLTNFAQMFVLGSIFPAYWLAFFSVAFVESLKDLSGCLLNNYRLKVDLTMKLIQQTDSDMSSLKQDYFSEMGLQHTNSITSTAPEIVIETITFSSYYKIFQALQPYIWYTSDIFYWLIYFASFVQFNSSKKTNSHLLPLQSENEIHLFKASFLRRLLMDLSSL